MKHRKSNKIAVKCEVNNITNSSADLYLYGGIDDDDYCYEDEDVITPKRVRDAIKDLGNIDLNIHLNTGGGSIYGSVAIHNYLKSIPNKVNIFIDSIAFSGGSIIAMAGDTITMYNNSMMMIHRASVGIYGNSDDLLNTVKVLNKFDEVVFNSYTKRFKGSNEDLKSLIDNETYLTSKDCFLNGLCDIIEGEYKAESIENMYNTFEEINNKSDIIDKMKELLKDGNTEIITNEAIADEIIIDETIISIENNKNTGNVIDNIIDTDNINDNIIVEAEVKQNKNLFNNFNNTKAEVKQNKNLFNNFNKRI